VHVMGINSTGLQPGPGADANRYRSSSSLAPDVVEALASTSLRCFECAALYPALVAGEPPRYRCDCGGVLDVEMAFQLPASSAKRSQGSDALLDGLNSDLAGGTPSAGSAWRQVFDERAANPPIWSISSDAMLLDGSGVWRYRELILPAPERFVVTRPEGNTSLYPVGIENCGSGRAGHRQIGAYAGLERLFLKHEGENPTGSFKDRGMTAGVTMAHMLGSKAVACASTGNTSASLASYAAQAGMQGIVFLPAGNVSAGKLAQSLAYGAKTVQIEGDFDDAMRLVEQVCNEMGIYLLNSLNPFRIEGQKAIGFEILQQLDWQAPDWLVLPAGNLGNTSAIGKVIFRASQLSKLPVPIHFIRASSKVLRSEKLSKPILLRQRFVLEIR
jgi:threonine synthase